MQPVIVMGSINMDIVLRVSRIPLAGETILATSMEKNAGGKGANQAAAAAKMGAAVHMVGCVGADEAGDALVASLNGCGVQTGRIEHMNGAPTGTALITVSDDGENCIVVCPGTNQLASIDQLTRDADFIGGASHCVFQLELPHDVVFEAIRRCRALGVKAVLNPSPSARIPDDVLKCVSLLILNESEFEDLAGKAVEPADFLRQKGVGDMLVTLGARGLIHIGALGSRFYPAESAKAVDSTGAGDCLLGALVAMLAEGKPMEAAIPIAMRAAAISVTRAGAMRSMPHRGEVLGIDGARA